MKTENGDQRAVGLRMRANHVVCIRWWIINMLYSRKSDHSSAFNILFSSARNKGLQISFTYLKTIPDVITIKIRFLFATSEKKLLLSHFPLPKHVTFLTFLKNVNYICLSLIKLHHHFKYHYYTARPSGVNEVKVWDSNPTPPTKKPGKCSAKLWNLNKNRRKRDILLKFSKTPIFFLFYCGRTT